MPGPYTRPDDTPAIVQVDPPGPRLLLRYRPTILRQGGVGGWVERPHDRAKSTVEWLGTPAHYMTLGLFFDAVRRPPGVSRRDVEADLDLLHRFGQNGGRRPPILQLTFGHGQQIRWVITDIIHRTSELDPSTKRRVQAAVDVDLLEWRPTDLALSPVESVEAAPEAPGRFTRPDADARTYTVRAGDTLSSIAARELGRASRWPEIGALNGLANPDLIVVGQVLTLPAR